MMLSRFDAVIYDMDGVLIDSEPLWKIAMEAVFKEVGCPLTRSDFEKTVGLRIDEVIRYWYAHQPWPEVSPDAVEKRIVDRMGQLIRQHGEPLPGVLESLRFFREKGMKIGLATSSYEVLIEAVLEVLDIASHFDYTHSAEHEEFGKPHPAVYLHTATVLGVTPTRCLVIEDSINGVISGKSARMMVFCVPEKTHEPNPKLIVADALFDNLHEVIQHFTTHQ